MHLAAFLFALMVAVPAPAQDNVPDSQAETSPPAATRPADPVVEGQRQSTDQIARDAGIKPMARVGNRIDNRIQFRINNRLERGYRPSTSVTAPYVAAGEQARRPTRSIRR